jgi:hypothetical protein
MFRICIFSILFFAGSVSPLSSAVVIHEIYGDHWVMWDSKENTSRYLYLFMPGSGQLPEVRSEWVLESAAESGLRAIGLAYQNQGSVSDKCWTSKDPHCMERVRIERIYGIDASEEVECSYEESVVGLLDELLHKLHELHPEMDWLKWIDENGDLVWNNIIVAGHSQGAGNAAFIAKEHEVARAIMYAGPFDRDTTGAVDYKLEVYGEANWIELESVTPQDRYFAFYHIEDNAPYTFILEDNFRKLLGIRTEWKLDVDAVEAFTGMHRFLYTQKDLHPKQSPHTYPLLERFDFVHRYLCSYGLE